MFSSRYLLNLEFVPIFVNVFYCLYMCKCILYIYSNINKYAVTLLNI